MLPILFSIPIVAIDCRLFLTNLYESMEVLLHETAESERELQKHNVPITIFTQIQHTWEVG